MGNDIQRPNPKLIKNVDNFREYTSAKLKDIRDSTEFWREKKLPLVGKADFDEVRISDGKTHFFRYLDISSKIQRFNSYISARLGRMW
jgi:hypothetical protein